MDFRLDNQKNRKDDKMALKPEYLPLIMVLEKRLFAIPDYQRAYSWKTQQRKELFQDIEKVLYASDSNRHHFMATIVCLQTNQTEEIGTDELERVDIVDGQQRLTTLIILLKAIAIFLEKSGGELEKVEADKLNELIVKDNGRLILLQTNHVSKVMFANYLTKGKMPNENELTTQAEFNLNQAFLECEKFVEGFGTSNAVLNLLKIVKNRLDFIFYVLEDEGAVYTVFEVLNSRGLAVAWLDKCKSMIMGIVFENYSSVLAKEKMILLHDIWSNIYSTIGKQLVKDDEILTVSATLWYEGESLGKPLSVEKSVECFRNTCLENAEKTVDVSQWILKVTKELVKLYSNTRLNAVTDISHARMLAIAIRLADHYSQSDREEMLAEWEKVTFLIFGLHRMDSRFRVGDYVRVARKISKNLISKDDAVQEIHSIADRFTIQEATSKIMGEDWYGSYDNDLKYLLYRYEEYLTAKAGEKVSEDIWEKIWSATPATTIEHIHPKTYTDKWKGKIGNSQEDIDEVVNRIGNLILLPPGINSKAGQKTFEEKKEVYKSYHLLMLNKIVGLSDWNKATIDNREMELLSFIEEMWG